MSNGLRTKVKVRRVCHKCGEKFKGKTYMLFKASEGLWVCPRCGATKVPKELKEMEKARAKT